MPQLLTRRKQAWIERRQPQMVRGGMMAISVSIPERYYAKLANLIHRMMRETKAEIETLFNGPIGQQYFAQDASMASQARILTNALTEKFNGLFADRAKPYAETMVGETTRNSSAKLHSSIQELSGGLSLKTTAMPADLYEVLNASVVENVGLIKSISAEYLQGVQGAVMRSITTGNGMQDLVPYLKKHEGITLRRARNIAEDQSRKAFSAITRQRMEYLGLKKFQWVHSSASREPRKLHQELNGKIFSFDDPPVIDLKTGERGFPGQLINCKCVQRPIIVFEGEE